MSSERERVAGFGKLENGLRQAGDWYRWGPYVSERQWGTVREDYSADGEAWDYLPHDHARSRAYRWGEDSLAGFCDVEQRLCLGLALWNGHDPILKERAFGLTGAQGNHGEDVKEYWWYLDAVPSHAWNRWRYHYPQGPFPYQDLIDVNGSRNKFQPEYELIDTGIFDSNRYWIVEAHYAKADPDDLLMAITVTNAGPDTETLHVLPTAWFRNTWSWDYDSPKPALGAAEAGPPDTAAVSIQHPFLGELELTADAGPDGTVPQVLFCENETNLARLYGVEPSTPYPKDGINDHVVSGAASVNPGRTGTKCAFWYQVTVPAGQTVELRVRLRPAARKAASGGTAVPFGTQFDQVMAERRAEADEFYDELTPRDASADEAMVMRQAFAGMLWSKQLFYYDVKRWLDGDPTQPTPPAQRLTGRNSHWRNFDAFDIMSMPDKWEYPWFAAWDLAFHCVALAHVDPAFAKYQLILLCREWFQHPNGALPAYEWDFSVTSTRRCRRGRRWKCSRSTGAATWTSSAGSSTSCWSTSPGGSTWRTLGATTCSRAASSAWTTSARSTARTCPSAAPWSSPTPPAGWASTRSPWAHRRRPEPVQAAASVGSRAQVPGALRRHPRRPGQPGPVGRGRRALLRPDRDTVRGAGAGEGPVDGRHHPGARGRGHRGG